MRFTRLLPPNKKQIGNIVASHSQTRQAVKILRKPNCLEEASTNRAAWKRLRTTEPPGKETLQHIELLAGYALVPRICELSPC